jgi:phage baseplate assembly protein gpV
MARSAGGDQAFIKFTLDGLLRADIEARNKSYSTGLQAGYLTINDVRRWEELPPINDVSADTVRVPLANVNVESADLSATSQRVEMATKLVQVGYDPAAVLAAFGLDAIEHTGVPSVQLQPTAQIDPEDPQAVYEV